jgi:hypothetical protein
MSFQSPTVKIVKETVRKTSVTVLKDGTPTRVDVRHETALLTFPNNESRQVDLILLHDPRGGAFWWRYQNLEPGRLRSTPADPLDELVVYVTGDRVQSFQFLFPRLSIHTSGKRYQTMEQGEAAVLAELQKKAELYSVDHLDHLIELYSDDHLVDLYKALGRDFLDLKNSAAPFPKTTIRSVARKKGKWHLMLEGPNKDTAEVVLNDAYEVVRATRIPRKESEK